MKSKPILRSHPPSKNQTIPLDISARLDELRALEDGWLDGEGTAPTVEGLDWFEHELERHFPNEIPRPYLYPTTEGGVQAEWSLGVHEISVEVDLCRQKGVWHYLNMEMDREETRDLNLGEPLDWVWLSDQIRQFQGDTE